MDTPQPVPPPVSPPTPPITDQSTPAPIITPPKRQPLIPPKVLKLLIIIPASLIGLLIILAIVLRIRSAIVNRPIATTPTPTPTEATSSATPEISQPITQEPKTRLSLSQISGHRLVSVSNGYIWQIEFTPDGLKKRQLSKAKGNVIDLSVSPSRELVVVTYTRDTDSANKPLPFPATGLDLINLTSGEVNEIIPTGQLAVRRPTWLRDNSYISLWNNGQSATVFDMVSRRRVVDVTPESGMIGQIVFVPNKAKIAYADNNVLYEAEYDNKNKTKILEDINGIRTASDGQKIPDPYVYTPDAKYIIYHNSIGQLVVFNTQDQSKQILAEGQKKSNSSEYYAFGELVGVDSKNKYIAYYNTGKMVYVAGPDDNPMYYYDLNSKQSTPLFASRKTPTDLAGIMPAPDSNKYALVGFNEFKVFSYGGEQLSNCQQPISNDYTYDPSRLWSRDSKYLLSLKDFRVVDTATCATTIQVDPEIPQIAVWIK